MWDNTFKITVEKLYDIRSREAENVQVFTGLELYSEIIASRNNKKSVRKQFEQFEEFIKYNFFPDKKSFDIVAKVTKIQKEQNILIHIEGEEEDREISELGDGIQALLVLMYPIFMANDKSMIFMEEPEIHLHPGLQTLFIRTLAAWNIGGFVWSGNAQKIE